LSWVLVAIGKWFANLEILAVLKACFHDVTVETSVAGFLFAMIRKAKPF
jgi:hypothetical protein